MCINFENIPIEWRDLIIPASQVHVQDVPLMNLPHNINGDVLDKINEDDDAKESEENGITSKGIVYYTTSALKF